MSTMLKLMSSRFAKISQARSLSHVRYYQGGSGWPSDPSVQEIKEKIESYEFYLDSKKVPTLKEAFDLRDNLRRALFASGHKDSLLEHKAKMLVQFARSLELYRRNGNLTSLLFIHLMCKSHDLRGFRLNREVRMVHALCIKLELQDPEWVMSKLMGLYESNGDINTVEKLFLLEKASLFPKTKKTKEEEKEVRMVHALCIKLELQDPEWVMSKLMGLYESIGDINTVEKLVEKLFLLEKASLFPKTKKTKEEEKEEEQGRRNQRPKGIVVFNQMIASRAKYCPEKTGCLLGEMFKRDMAPNNVTFKGLLTALSLVAKSESIDDAIHVIKRMDDYGVDRECYHWGALVDALARTRNSFYIGLAVDVIKGLPLSRDQQSFNAVLSRCVLEQAPGIKDPKTEEEKKEVKMKIDAAQDMVDFLEEKNYRYAVLEKTFWRLKDLGLKWPQGVRKIDETDETELD